MTEHDLPEGWDESAERIAWYCAKQRRGDGLLSLAELHEAALDGILDHVTVHGWPQGDFHPLFQAAGRAITHEAHEAGKHLRHWAYWYEPPGVSDPLGEAITDRMAVWQVVQVLTEHQWTALWSLAEVMNWGGTWRDAAALAQMSPGAYRMLLCTARKRCRELWISPGDTPRGHWARGGSWDLTRNTRMAGRIRARNRARVRKEDHRAMLAEAAAAPDAQLADVETLSAITGGNITARTIRDWACAGDLVRRGRQERSWLYSIDEFIKLAVERGKLGKDPREQAA